MITDGQKKGFGNSKHNIHALHVSSHTFRLRSKQKIIMSNIRDHRKREGIRMCERTTKLTRASGVLCRLRVRRNDNCPHVAPSAKPRAPKYFLNFFTCLKLEIMVE